MNKTEIAKSYITKKGFIPITGVGFEPMMPYIMMDVVYQTFNEEIKPLKVRNELKKYRNKWSKSYDVFNHEFFSVFDQNEVSDVIDMMDEFEEFIANDVMILRSVVMNLFSDLEFEQKKVVAACTLCNIITQSAQILWGVVYRNKRGKSTSNPQLSAIEQATHEFMNAYYISDKVIDINSSAELSKAVNALCVKMMQYIDV